MAWKVEAHVVGSDRVMIRLMKIGAGLLFTWLLATACGGATTVASTQGTKEALATLQKVIDDGGLTLSSEDRLTKQFHALVRLAFRTRDGARYDVSRSAPTKRPASK